MPPDQQPTSDAPVYRSGAVARLTGIPVQTLRVWERRYKIVGPRQSATGQRQYSLADVARLTVIKQLVALGHAIGSIAALDAERLQAMLERASRAPSAMPRPTETIEGGEMPRVREAIVGDALAIRVEHHRLPWLDLVMATPDLERAFHALRDVAVDVLLIELPTLQRDSARDIRALARQIGAQRIIVEYGYGPQRIRQELGAAGCNLVHAPLDAGQLESLCLLQPAAAPSGVTAVVPQASPAAQRRFDNKTLAAISVAAVALNCECPHHLSDLLLRLGNFETYSAECENRSPADAALHRYLKETTGTARALLETALQRVIEVEGVSLPA
ncbi:MAG: MerR family transcriptional regulator [Acidimicrobiia bacterium]